MCVQQSGKSFEDVIMDGQDEDDRKSIMHYKDIEVGELVLFCSFSNPFSMCVMTKISFVYLFL